MKRGQYLKGMRLLPHQIYCARNRDGLTTFSNPFKNVASGTLYQYIGWRWEIIVPPPPPEAPISLDLFGNALPLKPQRPIGSITLFAQLLKDACAAPDWPVHPSVRQHMAKMKDAIIELPEDAELFCWCEVSAACHCDEIISTYKIAKLTA